MFAHEDRKMPAFRRGQFLMHSSLGIVIYARKVRGNKERIVVKRTDDNGAHVEIAVNELMQTDVKKPGKMQGTRQLLVMCDCGYRLRGSGYWLSQALPKCPLCDVEMQPMD